MICTKPPLFTVVTPLYNKGAYVEATLASVAAQTFDNYEMIVIDDGSTDDGPERVLRGGRRVRLVRQENGGPGAARNRGIALARGTWVAFLDADDLWRPNHLATLAGTIAACPDADVVAAGYERGEGLTLALDSVTSPAPRYIDFLREHRRIWTSTTAVRTAVLKESPFNLAWPGEDVDLWLRLAMRHRFAISPECTAVYVQLTGGAMDSKARPDAAIPIARQPVFVTLAAALADPAYAQRHGDLMAFRNQLLLDYVKPSLFKGHMDLAREYLASLRAVSGSAPVLYRVLANLPGPLVRAFSRIYGLAKRQARSYCMRMGLR